MSASPSEQSHHPTVQPARAENQTTLVLFVDLQEGLIEASKTNPAPLIRRNAGALLTIARALDLPCRASVIPGGPTGAAPMIAELGQATPPLDAQTRRSISALSAVDGRVDRLILCGLAMEAAILHTALAARDAGFCVEVLLDVCGGLSARTEDAAIRRMERAGVTTSSLPSFATGAVADLTSPRDQQVLRTLQTLL